MFFFLKTGGKEGERGCIRCVCMVCVHTCAHTDGIVLFWGGHVVVAFQLLFGTAFPPTLRVREEHASYDKEWGLIFAFFENLVVLV